MDYLQSDYGYNNELGQFFIPKIMQQQSRFKACKDDLVTLVKFEVEDGCIVLSYHDTVTREEHREMQESKPREIRAIDEFGRVVLLKEHREKLKISPNDALVSYLLSDDTIKLRTLAIKNSDLVETA